MPDARMLSSDWCPMPEHLIAELGGEYSTTDEDHRWLLRACAEAWEDDRAKMGRMRQRSNKMMRAARLEYWINRFGWPDDWGLHMSFCPHCYRVKHKGDCRP